MYDDLVAKESNFLRKYNNIYISENQYDILNKYNIDVKKYKSVKELIYHIEEILNSSKDQLNDLEWVCESLSEYDYYNNTNK